MTGEQLNAEQRLRVQRCGPLVDQLARVLSRRLARITEDELRSVGYEALVKCGLRYDPEGGASFRTFAHHRVRGAMIDAARRAVPGLRRRSRALRSLQANQALLEQARLREGTDGPDPRRLEQRVKAVADLVAQATAAVMLSRAGPKDPERIADEVRGDAETVIDDVRMRERVREAVGRCCSTEEQALLNAIYDEGLTMTELAERIGRNKSTVSRRHAALLQRLSAELGPRD